MRFQMVADDSGSAAMNMFLSFFYLSSSEKQECPAAVRRCRKLSEDAIDESCTSYLFFIQPAVDAFLYLCPHHAAL